MPTTANLSSVESDLRTPQQAADYIGVAEPTLRVWRLTGRYALPFVKVGRLVRYRMRDLDKWLSSRTQTSSSGNSSGEAQH